MFPANKLTLHPSKTKYILFSAGQHTELIDETLTLDGVAIEQIGLNCETKWFKFLGMRLDDKLSWEGQRAHVYQKAAAGTFMLARLKRTVPHRIRLMIYNNVLFSVFLYFDISFRYKYSITYSNNTASHSCFCVLHFIFCPM